MTKDRSKRRKLLAPIVGIGNCGVFLARMLGSIRFERELLISTLQQTYLIGARSLVIIMICGFFVGMVLSPSGD
jgi:phospholipid/cholesterol/gamma-HCH transport system permease protein